MIAYFIDEIPRSGMEEIRTFLEKTARPSSMEKIFWGTIPEDLLSEQQYEHRDCWPHVFAIELGDDWFKMEFFVRPLHSMHCTCCAYTTRQQRDFILNFANTMIRDLGIQT
jgi:hypothetical protein